MQRLVVTIVVLGLTALLLWITKPSMEDYYEELQSRQTAIQSQGGLGETLPVGSNALDEMMLRITPERAMDLTEYQDYGIMSIFVTYYNVSDYERRELHSVGIMSTFITSTK